MAKFNGYGGNNMNNLLKQAQKMQKQMEEAQKNLEEQVYTVTTGGGAVEAVINGKRELLSLKLSEDIVDPEDIETLQDAVVAAVNEALRRVDAESQSAMGKITGMPGGLGF